MMRMDKESSKSGGGYVGGFFQLFDWKAKSRKKLFSSKSDFPECSKQGKKYEGNLPTTRLHLIEDDDTGAKFSVKGSSDYSCASSVTDDEGYGTRAPNVVARLMGLDTMPMSSYAEPYSSPLSDTQSLQDSHYQRRKLSYHHDHQIMHSGDLYKLENCGGNSFMEVSPQKMSSRPSNLVKESKSHKISSTPIERFQTEGLPPKSAKSIPITHHKLLSPIKSPGFIPSKNAAYIMEAAARIIEPGPRAASKAKMPMVSSSSIPLRVRYLKERAEAGQKMSTVESSAVSVRVQEIKEKVEGTYKSSRLAESSRRPADSNASKCLKGQSLNKSWNGSVDTTSLRSYDSGENSSESIDKRKSVSLAIQAKVNVQRREGLKSSGNRSLLEQKEQTDRRLGQPFKSQSNSQKNLHKKSSVQNVSVLRQNNQKQNCPFEKTKATSKSLASNSQGRKVLSGDLSSGRHKASSKASGSSKHISRKSSLETIESEKNVSSCGAKTLPRKKRMLEGEHFDRNQTENRLSNKNHKSILSEVSERPLIWTEDGRKKGMDVVSFTFSAPITRSMSKTEATSVIEQKRSELSIEHQGKGMLLGSDNMKFSSPGYNVIGGDALSLLLEEKLKELTLGVNTSHRDENAGSTSSSTSILGDLQGPHNNKVTKSWLSDIENNATSADRSCALYDSESFTSCPPALEPQNKFLFQEVDEIDAFSSNKNDIRKSAECRNPSPISILEPSLWTESCNSSYSTDSNIMEGIIQCSSVEANIGLSSANKSYTLDIDMDLSDSASSTSVGINVGMQSSGSFETDFKGSSAWELEYVKEILSNVELMFRDFALGRAREIVNPHLFHRLEIRKGRIGSNEDSSKMTRKLLFDGVSECLDLKCRRYAGRGFRTWVEGVSKVRRNDRLAQEVFREISGWRGMKNCMVDELVDKDMSSQYGKWLDYEVDAFSIGVKIEDQIFSSLVDEVVADIIRC